MIDYLGRPRVIRKPSMTHGWNRLPVEGPDVKVIRGDLVAIVVGALAAALVVIFCAVRP